MLPHISCTKHTRDVQHLHHTGSCHIIPLLLRAPASVKPLPLPWCAHGHGTPCAWAALLWTVTSMKDHLCRGTTSESIRCPCIHLPFAEDLAPFYLPISRSLFSHRTFLHQRSLLPSNHKEAHQNKRVSKGRNLWQKRRKKNLLNLNY